MEEKNRVAEDREEVVLDSAGEGEVRELDRMVSAYAVLAVTESLMKGVFPVLKKNVPNVEHPCLGSKNTEVNIKGGEGYA